MTSKILELYSRVANLRGQYPSFPIEPPSPSFDTFHWIGLARSYLEASKAIQGSPLPYPLPWTQLIGHSLECALKACLCAANISPPIGHDVIQLLDRVEGLGYSVPDHSLAQIVTLSFNYHRDPKDSGSVCKTKFKARYPAADMSVPAPIVRFPSFVVEAVEALLEQAADRYLACISQAPSNISPQKSEASIVKGGFD